MKKYTDLPIYRDTYQLLRLMVEVTGEFPNKFKYNLGTRLVNEATDLVLLIYKANAVRGNERVAHIDSFLENIQVVEVTTRLCKDLQAATTKQYANIVELTDKLGRQAQGWKKHARQNG